MNASMNDRKKAVLLAAVLLVIAILCGIRIYAVSHSSTGNGQALYADIYQSGELLETIRLDTVTDEYTFEVPGANGASNTVCGPSGRSPLSLPIVRIRSVCIRDLSAPHCFPSPVYPTGW